MYTRYIREGELKSHVCAKRSDIRVSPTGDALSRSLPSRSDRQLQQQEATHSLTHVQRHAPSPGFSPKSSPRPWRRASTSVCRELCLHIHSLHSPSPARLSHLSKEQRPEEIVKESRGEGRVMAGRRWKRRKRECLEDCSR